MRRFFRSPLDALVTLLCLGLIALTLPPILNWMVFDARWAGSGGAACAGVDGACWPFVRARFLQFLFGTYPAAERWRVIAALAVGALGVAALAHPRVGRKGLLAAALLTLYPVAVAKLLLDGAPTDHWGGLTLTLVVAVWGIVTSIPLGLLLAIGRRSPLPAVRWVAVAFIEFWRGLPLIGVLFLAAAMFPLLVPAGVELDVLMRALLAFSLFNAAYMAEVFRGGLQAVGRGQAEAATSLGLGYWRSLQLVVLPQAIRISVPALVNTCITIVKESTVLLTIGLFELLAIVQAGMSDPEWLVGPQIVQTGYVFAGIAFWIMCFGLARFGARFDVAPGRTA